MNVELFRVDAGSNTVAVLGYEARRSRNVTLVVGHGYSSSKQNLDMLCAFLASHGFTLYSLDFPGHKLGSSGGRLNTVTDLTDAMHAVVAAARARGAGTLYVMGHSMGATTALCTAGDDRDDRRRDLDRNRLRPAASARCALARRRRRLALVLRRRPRAAGTRQRSGSRCSMRALPKLAGRPTLFIAAERDGMVSRASVEELFARAPEPKSFATVASDHTFAGDNSRAAVLGLAQRAPPARPRCRRSPLNAPSTGLRRGLTRRQGRSAAL